MVVCVYVCEFCNFGYAPNKKKEKKRYKKKKKRE